MPILKRPSPRAYRYAQLLAEGYSKGLAARLAGYSPSTARNPGRAIHAQPGVSYLLHKALGPRSQVWGLGNGLEATKLEIRPIFRKTDHGWEKVRGKYAVEVVPDQRVRLKYLELTFKALGWIK